MAAWGLTGCPGQRTTSEPPPATPALADAPLPFGSSQLQAGRWPAGHSPSPRAQMAVPALGGTSSQQQQQELLAKATGGPSEREEHWVQPHGCPALPPGAWHCSEAGEAGSTEARASPALCRLSLGTIVQGGTTQWGHRPEWAAPPRDSPHPFLPAYLYPKEVGLSCCQKLKSPLQALASPTGSLRVVKNNHNSDNNQPHFLRVYYALHAILRTLQV